MKERRGDARIYIIAGFFFLCVLSGGLLLGLYIFLPENYSQSWYSIVGMILVAIPWFFWFFAYLYRCCLPLAAATTPPCRTPGAVASAAASTAKVSSCEEDSPVQSPVKPPVTSGRHVHFGAVVVMGGQGNKNVVNGGDQMNAEGHLSDRQDESPQAKKDSADQRESETPLDFTSEN